MQYHVLEAKRETNGSCFAYEKGKKDSTKDAMGDFGKQKGDPSDGNKEIGALGKELAKKHVSNKSDFDYFKKN